MHALSAPMAGQMLRLVLVLHPSLRHLSPQAPGWLTGVIL